MSGFLNNATNTTINNSFLVNNGAQGPLDQLKAAASPSAFFDAGDQFDAPKCHPNTRVAVMKLLREFGFGGGFDVTRGAKALWLTGPAGAGKSAIARSLCEELHASQALLANYFFNRTDPTRNTLKAFVATIAYEIYGKVPERYGALILAKIQQDPLVFTRSLASQFQSLIMIPLTELFESNYFQNAGRRLIVIDGLDECFTAKAQISLLQEIQSIVFSGAPFIFLIASRPEQDIQSFFMSSGWESLHHRLHRLDLDVSYRSDGDIERFLVDKLREVRLNHPLKATIPAGWPSGYIIEILVRKASGLFIYASLVVKYVASKLHQPHKRLDIVLGLHPPNGTGDLPFAELDALYTEILSSCPNIDLVLRIIGPQLLQPGIHFSLELFAAIHRMEYAECVAALSHLWSILRIDQRTGTPFHNVVLSHKSLLDYLSNITRSGRYMINRKGIIATMAAHFFQLTSDPRYFSIELAFDTSCLIPSFFVKYGCWSPLIESFMSLSLLEWYKAFERHSKMSGKNGFEVFYVFHDRFWKLFPILIRAIKQLAATGYSLITYENVCDNYRAQFRDLSAAIPHICLMEHAAKHRELDRETVQKVHNAIWLNFECYYPDIPMPQAYTDFLFSLGFANPVNGKNIVAFDSREGHHTALQCIELIRKKSASKIPGDYDVVLATLRAFSWIIASQTFNKELYEACDPWQTHGWSIQWLSMSQNNANPSVDYDTEKHRHFKEPFNVNTERERVADCMRRYRILYAPQYAYRMSQPS